MMNKDNFQKAKLLYDVAVANEIPMENPDDVTLSIQNMLAEIRALGYEEYHYFADVKLRNIKDPRIMKILLKYYDEMDLVTKDSLMYKIHPKYYPEVINIAKKEFLNLSPIDRMSLNGFQTAMSKGKVTDSYLNEMFELLDVGEYYASLSMVRKMLCKNAPERMLPLIEKYSKGVLILCAIQDCAYLSNCNSVINKLKQFVNISNEEVNCLLWIAKQNLSVTTYEYYRNLCTASRIKADTKKVLKKINQQKY